MKREQSSLSLNTVLHAVNCCSVICLNISNFIHHTLKYFIVLIKPIQISTCFGAGHKSNNLEY